jgi:hypothetical protein
MPSFIYQYVINLVMSLPIRIGPGVLMNVSVPSENIEYKNKGTFKKSQFPLVRLANSW